MASGGLRRATDLLLLGERFTGGRAQQWGLAHAVPAGKLLDAAGDLAERLAAGGRLGGGARC